MRSWPDVSTGRRTRPSFWTSLQDAVDEIEGGEVSLPLAGIEDALGEYEPLVNEIRFGTSARHGTANVLDYGADPTGTADSTSAFEQAIASGASRVIVPQPSFQYKISDATLYPLDNQEIHGIGGFPSDTTYRDQVRIYAGAGDRPLFDVSGKYGVTFKGLSLLGNGIVSADPTEMAIVGGHAFQITIDKCHIYRFGGPGIKVTTTGGNSVGWFIRDSQLLGCCYGYANITETTGALDLDGTDHYIQNNELKTPGQVSGYLSGYTVALYVRSAANFISFNTFELSERGAVFGDNAKGNMVIGNSSELNYGDGWFCSGYENIFMGNRAERNGIAADATYDGYVVTGRRNQFIGNSVASLSSGEAKQRYGFRDTSSNTVANSNIYIGNKGSNLGTSLYSVSDADNQVIDFESRQTYAASNVTTDRTFDADATTTAELADVVGTLIADLRAQGLVR